MRSSQRNAVTLLVLACYALSLTVGGWFHDHHPGIEPGDPSCCHGESHAENSGARHPDHDGALPFAQRGGGAVEAAHGCAVCQFLSQRIVPARPTQEIQTAAVVEELSLPRIAILPIRPVSPWLSRGPPATILHS